jgi:uncharacterized protein YegP (UPF0339 family)
MLNYRLYPTKKGVFHGWQVRTEKSKDGQFMFNLKAANGQVILTSEIYKTKPSAENGIESVRKSSRGQGRRSDRLTTWGGSTGYPS